MQAQFEALNQKLKEVEKQNNRFRLIYGNYDCVEQKDIKALQVALNLSQNKPCNISDDREDIKHCSTYQETALPISYIRPTLC